MKAQEHCQEALPCPVTAELSVTKWPKIDWTPVKLNPNGEGLVIFEPVSVCFYYHTVRTKVAPRRSFHARTKVPCYGRRHRMLSERGSCDEEQILSSPCGSGNKLKRDHNLPLSGGVQFDWCPVYFGPFCNCRWRHGLYGGYFELIFKSSFYKSIRLSSFQ